MYIVSYQTYYRSCTAFFPLLAVTARLGLPPHIKRDSSASTGPRMSVLANLCEDDFITFRS